MQEVLHPVLLVDVVGDAGGVHRDIPVVLIGQARIQRPKLLDPLGKKYAVGVVGGDLFQKVQRVGR